MDNKLGEYMTDGIKWFFTIVGTTILVSLVYVMFVQQLGLSNVIDNKITGSGNVYHRTAAGDGSAGDYVNLDNASYIDYHGRTEWNETNRTLESTLNAEVGTSKYKYAGQTYQVTVKSAATGFGHSYKVSRINGSFSGSSTFTLTQTSVESLILMDGNGNHKIRVVDATGRHVTNAVETDLVGKFVVESYMKIGKPIKETSDWLAFCATVNKGLATGDIDGIPQGTTIEPMGADAIRSTIANATKE